MNFPIDSYEIRARYAPALIISSPVLITLWTCSPTEFHQLSAVAGGVISLVLWYCLAVFVRYKGKAVEPELWDEWGGNLAANYILWGNKGLNDDLKRQYREAVENHLSLPLATKQEESADIERAHDLAKQAFLRVKGFLRKHDPAGLWWIDLAEYGFARNLYGSRGAWKLISFTMATVAGYFLWNEMSPIILVGFLLNISMLYASFYYGGKVMKKTAKSIACRYVEHSWESFLNIVKDDNSQIENTKHVS